MSSSQFPLQPPSQGSPIPLTSSSASFPPVLHKDFETVKLILTADTTLSGTPITAQTFRTVCEGWDTDSLNALRDTLSLNMQHELDQAFPHQPVGTLRHVPMPATPPEPNEATQETLDSGDQTTPKSTDEKPKVVLERHEFRPEQTSHTKRNIAIGVVAGFGVAAVGVALAGVSGGTSLLLVPIGLGAAAATPVAVKLAKHLPECPSFSSISEKVNISGINAFLQAVTKPFSFDKKTSSEKLSMPHMTPSKKEKQELFSQIAAFSKEKSATHDVEELVAKAKSEVTANPALARTRQGYERTKARAEMAPVMKVTIHDMANIKGISQASVKAALIDHACRACIENGLVPTQSNVTAELKKLVDNNLSDIDKTTFNASGLDGWLDEIYKEREISAALSLLMVPESLENGQIEQLIGMVEKNQSLVCRTSDMAKLRMIYNNLQGNPTFQARITDLMKNATSRMEVRQREIAEKTDTKLLEAQKSSDELVEPSREIFTTTVSEEKPKTEASTIIRLQEQRDSVSTMLEKAKKGQLTVQESKDLYFSLDSRSLKRVLCRERWDAEHLEAPFKQEDLQFIIDRLDACLEYAKKFEKQPDRMPKYFHATSNNNLETLLYGRIEVGFENAYGAFVSTQPEFTVYGDAIFGFSQSLEKNEMHDVIQTPSAAWIAMAQPIVLNEQAQMLFADFKEDLIKRLLKENPPPVLKEVLENMIDARFTVSYDRTLQVYQVMKKEHVVTGNIEGETKVTQDTFQNELLSMQQHLKSLLPHMEEQINKIGINQNFNDLIEQKTSPSTEEKTAQTLCCMVATDDDPTIRQRLEIDRTNKTNTPVTVTTLQERLKKTNASHVEVYPLSVVQIHQEYATSSELRVPLRQKRW